MASLCWGCNMRFCWRYYTKIFICVNNRVATFRFKVKSKERVLQELAKNIVMLKWDSYGLIVSCLWSPLQISKENGTTVMIPWLQTNKAQRTLGVWLAPDGNNDKEYKYLLGKAHLWRNHMATAKFLQMAAEFSHRQVLILKLQYPLIAMTFSEQQCQNILKPIMTPQGLPAMGINRHFPWAVACGPLAYQGLNLPNLFTEQLIIQVIQSFLWSFSLQDCTTAMISPLSWHFRKPNLLHG